jgi:recombinational DNA repair protein RecR
MKISESTEFKIDLKTVIGIIMLTTTLVGMYYTLQEDIRLAKTLPPVEVTRLEYELKEEWNEEMILQLKDKVEMLEEAQYILKEEVNITSSMIKDGTEADGKLEELNRQLEELQNKKPSTRIIVKEVKVDKKGRKL